LKSRGGVGINSIPSLPTKKCDPELKISEAKEGYKQSFSLPQRILPTAKNLRMKILGFSLCEVRQEIPGQWE
jgi:hypothetical protein